MKLRSITGTIVGIAAVIAATSSSPATAATPPVLVQVTPAHGTAIPGSYVVTVDDALDPALVAKAAGITPTYLYRAALHGFAAEIPAAVLDVLQRTAGVRVIEQDTVFRVDATQTMDLNGDPWGLDRIDQRTLPLSRTYTYTNTASAVRAYVIDTGIYTSHPDFGGRASAVYDAFGGNGQDCNGHGTHVAGTIGGATYGVAKAALLRAVRVLNCAGSGTTSGIIAGIDWVRVNALKPAVANMSLGGGYSSSLNTAATNLANSGVFLAVAAGNENQDACNVSPASASGTLTVAATDKTDGKASFSNWGSCVDVYAPGVAIKSTWRNGGTSTISGTSMASPHAAGVGALYKSTFGDAASSTIVSWIINNSTAGVVSGNVGSTPNRMLFTTGL